jgi:response regulator of citrate/malate metabolism
MTGSDERDRDLRVLVVEDDPLTAAAHEAYVERCPGFRCAGVAGTASAAMLALRTAAADGAPIDLLLLDMNLPDMFGLELCRRVRAEGVALDVIAVTARRDASVVRAAVNLGIVQYLIKPFAFGTFARKMAAYREFATRMARTPVNDQHDVDALLAQLRPSTQEALPKTIASETRENVREALRAADGWVSAVELANALGVSRATVRRYLEHMVEVGGAERRARYGSPGRPELEYRERQTS